MDFEQLYSILPKEPKIWKQKDISLWLEFIGLEALINVFNEHSIDGSCLKEITDEDLQQDLKIKSSIIRKKLVVWLQNGLWEYQTFVSEKTENNNVSSLQIKQQKAPLQENVTQILNQNSNYIEPFMNTNQNVQNQIESLSSFDKTIGNKKKERQMIIQPIEGNQSNFYKIDEAGGKIGRHSTNQVLVLEESISRYHAEIKFQNNKFFLSDIGSTTGTFIKIIEKIQLEKNMQIEMGSNCFEITEIASKQQPFIQLVIIDGPNQNQKFNLNPKVQGYINIGRAQNNTIAFPDDQHLSTNHAKIYFAMNNFYLEEMQSTNGSWIKLTKDIQPYQLNNDTIFKIGTTQTFKVIEDNQIEEKENLIKDDKGLCVICCENERDALYMPCKHNIACVKCTNNIQVCPLCRVFISDFIMIYKA